MSRDPRADPRFTESETQQQRHLYFGKTHFKLKTLILTFLLKIKNLHDPILSYTSYVWLCGIPKEIEVFSKPGFQSRVYICPAHTGIAMLVHK